MLDEVQQGTDTEYMITSDGHSYLSKKKKVPAIEAIEFGYYYNDLTLEFVDASQFIQDYKFAHTHMLQSDRIEIPHRNRPVNSDRVKLATFFNKLHKGITFYDLASDEIVAHKRSVCFMALEYKDQSGTKIYKIRHFGKTVKSFTKYRIDEDLSSKASAYFRKHPPENGTLTV